MKLKDLFLAVKEPSLTKQQLEDYHKELSELLVQMKLELGSLKKKKGMFMINHPELTGIAMTRQWDGSEEGQRKFEIESYIGATNTQLSSLKARLYSVY